MSDGTIIIDTMLDNLGVEKGISEIGKTAKAGLSIFTGAIVGAGAALGALGVKSLETASDLNEVQNVVDTTFGSGASQINDWANSANTAFGLSTLQAKQFTGTLGAMLKSSGVASSELVGMSENMVGLAGDFASFYNLQPEEAFEKIRSGISGETEPLKQLGINMSVANLNAYALSQGMSKTYDAMSQAEQTQLRYNYLMSVSKDAQGDFAKTSDSFANQMRVASLNVKSLFADIGQLLLPVAQNAVKSFNDVANKLREAFQNEEVKANIQAIAENIGNLVTKIAELIANNLPKMIEGLTWIMNNANTIAGGIIAIGTALTVMKGAAVVMALVDAFRKAQEVETTLTFTTWLLNAAMSALGGPWGIIAGLIAGAVVAIIYFWNTNESFRNYIITAWQGIQSIFQAFDSWLTGIFTTDWSNSFGIFGEYLNAFLANASNIWDAIKQVFSGVIDFVAGVFTGNWSQAWQGVVEIFGGIFGGLEAIAKAPLNAVIALINMAIDGLNSISVDIPDFVPGVGGQHFGVNIPKVDYLYTGGVFDKPTLLGNNTVVGDKYKGTGSQREWVLPDKLLRETINEVVGDKLSNLFSLMSDTVGYETAKTTASVVAQNNFTVKQADNNSLSNVASQLKIDNKLSMIVDGREMMITLAPYQDEFENYNVGRTP